MSKPSVVLVLTAEGEALAEQMMAAQAEAQNQRLSWLEEGQREQLEASLRAFIKILS